MPIGTVWAPGTWDDTAWAEGSWGDTAVLSPAAPGGTFRRPTWSWPRVFARSSRTWPRTWRYTVVRVTPETLTVLDPDDRDFLFDFSASPEVASGDTIASAVIRGGAGLTIGTPTPTSDDTDGIPAGQAMQVRISGWAAGETYTLSCVATLNTGRKLTIPGRLVAAADF